MAKKVLTLLAVHRLLREHRGASFVTFTSATKPRVLKRDRETGEVNPHGQIVKVSRVNGIIGFRYENSVNNQRTREGVEVDFEAAERSWGERVKGTPLVEGRGGVYLEVKVERTLDKPRYYNAKGLEISYESCKGVLPARKGESSRQELDKEVILRDYSLANLRRINMNGDEIEIVS